jgi:hypothetical protein
MKAKHILMAVLMVCFFASQSMAVPDLYYNGSMVSPATSPDADTRIITGELVWEFTLIAEMTPHADMNTFGFYTDLGVGSNMLTVFDDDDSPITKLTINTAGIPEVGMFLHNDLDDDGVFNNNDVLLFSERGLSLPNPPGSDYQWFMGYNTFSPYGHYQFGSLEFWGKYDILLFIDDDHVTGPNYDHNDMVIGGTIVPEPTTLILLGLGLAGAGIIRRKRS